MQTMEMAMTKGSAGVGALALLIRRLLLVLLLGRGGRGSTSWLIVVDEGWTGGGINFKGSGEEEG